MTFAVFQRFASSSLRRRLGWKHRCIKHSMGWLVWSNLLLLMLWTYRRIPSTSHDGSGASASPRALVDTTTRGIQADGKQAPQDIRAAPVKDLKGIFEQGYRAYQEERWEAALEPLSQVLALKPSPLSSDLIDGGRYALARCHAELGRLEDAQRWTDALYRSGSVRMAEPAYHLCRGLREKGRNLEAYYYYLVARAALDSNDDNTNAYIPSEPAVGGYLLDYEKSILWSYVGGLADRYSRLHGVAHSMELLSRAGIPEHIRDSVFSNLQFYVANVPGDVTVLHEERPTHEEWRYSTPTFLGDETLVRVVNYYVADDGSYHISKGDKVHTRLLMDRTDETFHVALSDAFVARASSEGLIHPDSYVLDLEDTRVAQDTTRAGTVFTLSASAQYSHAANVMSQVLGTLSLANRTLTVLDIIRGPYPDRHDKNWVFAGGIDNVVYGWYPTIQLGRVDLGASRLDLHTEIPAPGSFHAMRGSTNGVYYRGEWWFVTHAVIYRPGQMRKYLHYVVVLDATLTRLVRHSMPFTFEKNSDVEYCLGLRVGVEGLTFGYSVRDRSSRLLRAGWEDVGYLFPVNG